MLLLLGLLSSSPGLFFLCFDDRCALKRKGKACPQKEPLQHSSSLVVYFWKRLAVRVPAFAVSLAGVLRAGRRACSPGSAGVPGRACLETPPAGARVLGLVVPARGLLSSPRRVFQSVPRLPPGSKHPGAPSGPPAATSSWRGGLGTPYPSVPGVPLPATMSLSMPCSCGRVVPKVQEMCREEAKVLDRAVLLCSCRCQSSESCRTTANL